MPDLDQRIRARLDLFHDGKSRDGMSLRDHQAASTTNALRAVLDMHKADEDGSCIPCNVATFSVPLAWPCPTVREVARALGITEEGQ